MGMMRWGGGVRGVAMSESDRPTDRSRDRETEREQQAAKQADMQRGRATE